MSKFNFNIYFNDILLADRVSILIDFLSPFINEDYLETLKETCFDILELLYEDY